MCAKRTKLLHLIVKDPEQAPIVVQSVGICPQQQRWETYYVHMQTIHMLRI